MKKKTSLILTFFLLISSSSIFSQSLKDLLNKDAVSKVVGSVTGNKLNVVGTWKYSGTAVELQSDNALKKVASAVASSNLENKINQELDKLGIQANSTTITFNKDNSFVIKTSKKDLNGKYEIDKKNNQLKLIVSGRMFKVDASQSLNDLSLLFNGDKIFEMATLLGDKINMSSVQVVDAILKEYDGIKIGIKLSK